MNTIQLTFLTDLLHLCVRADVATEPGSLLIHLFYFLEGGRHGLVGEVISPSLVDLI